MGYPKVDIKADFTHFAKKCDKFDDEFKRYILYNVFYSYRGESKVYTVAAFNEANAVMTTAKHVLGNPEVFSMFETHYLNAGSKRGKPLPVYQFIRSNLGIAMIAKKIDPSRVARQLAGANAALQKDLRSKSTA